MAADIRWWHPELPVVIKAGPAAPPAGCVSILACCSVKGQVDAVRRALQKAAADKPHENEPAGPHAGGDQGPVARAAGGGQAPPGHPRPRERAE